MTTRGFKEEQVRATAHLIADVLDNPHDEANLAAVREKDYAAQILGVSTFRYKLLAFSASAAFAGLSGALYAYYIQLVSPSIGSSSQSALVIGMAVFGGIGTIWGPFLGAILLFCTTEALRFVGDVYNLIAVGAVMVVFVIFVPRGLAGIRLHRRRRVQRADLRTTETT